MRNFYELSCGRWQVKKLDKPLLGEKTFQFSPVEWQNIHRKLFEGVFKHAGKIRDYNITKKEWVLKGNTVMCGNLERKKILDFGSGEGITANLSAAILVAKDDDLGRST